MSESWNDRRLARRVRAATGQPLRPFRWWQAFRRSVLSITLEREDRPAVHTIEVRHGGDSNGVVRACLYLDGSRHLESRLPARFPVDGGHIEVRKGPVGLRRCHFVAHDGTIRRLEPDPRSAEGRRARFARQHPAGSALVGAISMVMLIIGVALGALQTAEPIAQVPAIAATLGTFRSPVHLPTWLNLTLGLGAVVGSIERALRMQYHWLLDSGAAT